VTSWKTGHAAPRLDEIRRLKKPQLSKAFPQRTPVFPQSAEEGAERAGCREQPGANSSRKDQQRIMNKDLQ